MDTDGQIDRERKVERKTHTVRTVTDRDIETVIYTMYGNGWTDIQMEKDRETDKTRRVRRTETDIDIETVIYTMYGYGWTDRQIEKGRETEIKHIQLEGRKQT